MSSVYTSWGRELCKKLICRSLHIGDLAATERLYARMHRKDYQIGTVLIELWIKRFRELHPQKHYHDFLSTAKSTGLVKEEAFIAVSIKLERDPEYASFFKRNRPKLGYLLSKIHAETLDKPLQKISSYDRSDKELFKWLLAGLIKMEDKELALQLTEDMLCAGTIELPAYLYSRMKVYNAFNDVYEFNKAYYRYRRCTGGSPNEKVASFYISICCKNKDSKSAWIAFNELLLSGNVPNSNAFVAILQLCLEEQLTDRAVILQQHMKHLKIKVDEEQKIQITARTKAIVEQLILFDPSVGVQFKKE